MFNYMSCKLCLFIAIKSVCTTIYVIYNVHFDHTKIKMNKINFSIHVFLFKIQFQKLCYIIRTITHAYNYYSKQSRHESNTKYQENRIIRWFEKSNIYTVCLVITRMIFFKPFIFITFSVLMNFSVRLTSENGIVPEAIQITVIRNNDD